MPVLAARGLSKAFGPKVICSDLSLTIRTGEHVGLLGMNGTGKSSLLKMMANLEPADTGVIDVRRGARIGYLPQAPTFEPTLTCMDVVEQGLAEWHKATARYEEVTRALDKVASGGDHDALVHEQAHLAEVVEGLGGFGKGHEARTMLANLGVRDPSQRISELSGGELRRVAIARLFISNPQLAILDEPTNHLDAETIEWFETYLNDTFPGAVLVVTHDRYFLDSVCDRTVELEDGVLTSYQGGYADFLEQKATLMEHAARVESKRQNFVRRETEWLRRGPKARSTKQKARIERAHAAIDNAPKAKMGALKLDAATSRLGKSILDLDHVKFGYGDRVLIKDLQLNLVSGDRLGIVGPNGIGKTSLLKLVSGEEQPTGGKVVRGLNTKIAYFDQARSNLVEAWSVYDNVAEREGAEITGGGMVQLGDRQIELRSYLEQFLFDGQAQRQKVSSLSGGERARVALAKALRSGANVLLLDEPTNDLDVATLSALEELLESWPGCVLVVTHDRYFLNRVVTGILLFKGDGEIIRYPGNWDTYCSLREEEEAAKKAEAAPPPPKKAESIAPKSDEPKKGKSLTYAERLEFAGIMDKVSAAEEELTKLEARLGDPATYSAGGPDVAKLQADREAAAKLVETLTHRWEELERRSNGG